MASIDLFCAPDDQHRVVLLVDLLQQGGPEVVLRTEPSDRASDPCLVAWTSRAARLPWMGTMFESRGRLVAVRLDDTPLPGPCDRKVNMQSWPARSTDHKVEELAAWLLRHGPAAAVAPDPSGSASGPVAAGEHVPASGRRRRRVRTDRSDSTETRRNLAVLAFLLLGGYLVWSVVPAGPARRDDAAAEQAALENGVPGEWESGRLPGAEETPDLPGSDGGGDGSFMDGDGAASEHPLPTREGGSGALGSADVDPERISHAALLPSAGDARPLSGSAAQHAPRAVPAVGEWPASGQALPGGDATPESVSAGEASRPVASGVIEAAQAPVGIGGARRRTDALARLCAADSLAAARAWESVLNWKQRRRLPAEPCIAALVSRFPALGAELDGH